MGILLLPTMKWLSQRKTEAFLQHKQGSQRLTFMRKTVWILLLLALQAALSAQNSSVIDSLHHAFDDLLMRHVSADGRVDYLAIKQEHHLLKAYLQQLAADVPDDSAPKSVAMAYWINAYNAFTIDLIVRNYPLRSIMQLDKGKTWDVKRIQLGGKKYSLNQIEHELLRKKWPDPRIHFALNCAAQSCPPLYNRAYTATQLDTQLDERTRLFINHSGYNQLTGPTLKLSRLFEWYATDFGDLPSFLNKYAQKEIKTKKISYLEYNWDLNR